MKRLIAFCLSLCLLFSLCACGQAQETTEAPEPQAAAATDDPDLGRYICTAVTMDGMDLGPDGQWLELMPEGKALLCLGGEAEAGKWTLSGTAITLTLGSETVATGTLTNGTLTVKLLGMDCTFVKDSAESTTEPEAAETAPSTGTFSCLGLYTVTYPPDSFQAPGDGLTDLTSSDGAKIWFTKLDTKADANQWRKDFEAKLTETSTLQSETLDLTVGDYAGEVVIYENSEGWHAAVLVDLGRNRGSDGRSMTAACIYITAPTRESVWNETIQTMVSSLKLGQ